MVGSVRRRSSMSMFTLSGTAWRKKRSVSRSTAVRATHESHGSPPAASTTEARRATSAMASSSLGAWISTKRQQPNDAGSSGRAAKAEPAARARRRISRAAGSKYSSAAACRSRPRAATVASTAWSSQAKKQLTPQITEGAGMSSSTSSEMTPSVPSDPITRSTASMSSAAK